ncbi:hypothetical protein BGZ70_009755 [Mortierella alpina]|uniref:CoA-binding domain-containing protein n=1 Tax=Mortierella alpina TaxID=64518 RepID=A0A9P6M009_MORAP|nr:hypothetical protein BGZ70_009755 [Mortierella alpina]
MAAALLVREFFASAEQKFAVVGASRTVQSSATRYIDHGYTAVPVNPREKTIEALSCVPNLSSLPGNPAEYHVSIITPPAVTTSVLEEAHANGIQRVWLQPGAESPEALAFAHNAGIKILAGGPCVLEDGLSKEEIDV